MTNRPLSWLTLVVATHRPPSDSSADETLVGYALVEITKLSVSNWSFALDSSVAKTIGDEPELIAKLADRLPCPTFLLGRDIEADIIAPLRRAADRMAPPLREFANLRIALLQSACQVDLNIGIKPPKPPLPYAEPIERPAPMMIAVDGDMIVDVERARADLERRVVDEWLSFLGLTMGSRSASVARSASSARTSSIATATWLVSRGLVR